MYVDLHLHLLPGVDDGPPDAGAALEHAARISEAGVTEATVTPHVGHPRFSVEPLDVPRRTAELQRLVDRAGIELRLHPGGEVHPGGAARLSGDELHAVAQGPPTARWVLLEAPFTGVDQEFLAACRAVRGHGLGLVIAHPERASGLLEGGLRLLREELAAGAVLQVSVDSLLARHGEAARAAAVRLVRAGLAYVVASDGHGGARAHTLGEGPALLREAGASALQSWQLTQANPRFLLRHGIPQVPRPEERAARERRVGRTLAAARRRR